MAMDWARPTLPLTSAPELRVKVKMIWQPNHGHQLPQEFQGEDTLVANIIAEKPDYNQSDSATWPRMTISRLEEQLGPSTNMAEDLEDIPLGLAYDNNVAQMFGAQVFTSISIGAKWQGSHWCPAYNMSFRHYLFPYYYGPGGHTYSRSIPASDGEAEDDGPDSPATPTSATQAYREVLDMVDKSSTTELTNLQKQVDELKRALADQKRTSHNLSTAWQRGIQPQENRTAALEQALAAKDRELKDKDVELQGKDEALEEKNRTLRHKDTEIKHKSAELKARDTELEQNKKETAEVKQQVLDIWTKMKAASRDDSTRKAGEEGMGGADKKDRTG
ncbi:hypothetical protein E8E11_002477 [Didymella keratinophila]|nr:hypothetical protein E8E11_002477 [Didymella keratinophila]